MYELLCYIRITVRFMRSVCLRICSIDHDPANSIVLSRPVSTALNSLWLCLHRDSSLSCWQRRQSFPHAACIYITYIKHCETYLSFSAKINLPPWILFHKTLKSHSEFNNIILKTCIKRRPLLFKATRNESSSFPVSLGNRYCKRNSWFVNLYWWKVCQCFIKSYLSFCYTYSVCISEHHWNVYIKITCHFLVKIPDVK